MQTPFPHTIQDWSHWLEPIQPGNPTGSYLRHDLAVYDAIKNARHYDNPELYRGEYQKRSPKRADWTRVETLCTQALRNRSKDLKLAAWLIEAWLHRYGVPGLVHGLELVLNLCQAFWPDLYPALEPEQHNPLEMRLTVFTWMEGELPRALRQVVVAAPTTSTIPNRTWMDWELVLRNERILKQAPDKKAPHDIDRERFMMSVQATDPEQLRQLHRGLLSALENLQTLHTWLQGPCQGKPPGFPTLSHLLQHMCVMLGEWSPPEPELSPVPSPEPEPIPKSTDVAMEHTSPPTPASAQEPIQSRAEAYKRLAEVAAYLEQTEPHSPVHYLLRRAISWGDKSFEELLVELIKEPGQVKELFGLLGVERPQA